MNYIVHCVSQNALSEIHIQSELQIWTHDR